MGPAAADDDLSQTIMAESGEEGGAAKGAVSAKGQIQKEDGELPVLCEKLHRQGEPEGAHEERSF